MICLTKDPSYFCNTTEYFSTFTHDGTTTTDPTQQHDAVEPVVADFGCSTSNSPSPSLLYPRSHSIFTSTSFSPLSAPDDDADPQSTASAAAPLEAPVVDVPTHQTVEEFGESKSTNILQERVSQRTVRSFLDVPATVEEILEQVVDELVPQTVELQVGTKVAETFHMERVQ